MADRDAPPTLASLRRGRSNRPPPPRDPEPSLFDLFANVPPAPAAPLVFETPPPEDGGAVAPQIDIVATPARRSAPVATATAPEPGSPTGIRNAPSPRGAAPEPEPVPRHIWTVTDLLRHVRGFVERGYGRVGVEGEISNWRPAGSGHCYFTLKDAGGQVSAVLFRRQASLLRFRPKDGDAVRLHGQLTVYESRGQMQLVVEWMEQAGLGALLAAVHRLKESLRREGLFDRKRPLPPFPRCIGVITSLRGAALRDIVKVCRRRHANVQLLIYPAAVQGPNCAPEIAAGLRWFNAHPDRAEVVLVARGGGSWEDLHGFDDERVARAIAACVLPVVTGIGHAPDSTIADAAADLCAPTPSAAAELLTAGQHRVEERVEQLRTRVLRSGSFELLRAHGRLARLSARDVLRRVEDGLNRRSQRVDELGFRAEAATRARLRRREAHGQQLAGRLARQSPSLRLRRTEEQLRALQSRLLAAGQRRLAAAAGRVGSSTTRLDAMSPLRVLERGYALVYGPDGHLLRSANSTVPGDEIRARFAGGELRARVLPAPEPAIAQPDPEG